MFYILCKDFNEREKLIEFLKANKILCVFHYQSLHKSLYFSNQNNDLTLEFSEIYSNTLLRLPFFYDLSYEDQENVIKNIKSFYFNINNDK